MGFFWRRDSARDVLLRHTASAATNVESGAKDTGKAAAPSQPEDCGPLPDSPTGIEDFTRFSNGTTAHNSECSFDGSLLASAATAHTSRPMSFDESESQESEELADWEISEEQLNICSRPDGSQWVLGAGSFGKVFKATWARSDGCVLDVAMKMTIISPEAARRRSLCDRLEADFIREMALMKYLCSRDTHMVPFHGACVFEGRLCLVLELMQGGDLMDAIRGSLTAEFGWFAKGRAVALDVARGMAFLHSNRVVHCDLKSKNIMLTAAGDAKISDVGLSRMMHAGVNDHRTMDNDSGIFGTFAWAAPEMLMGEEPTPAVDIYSLGVVLWEICCQEMPQRGRRRDPTPQEAPLEVAAVIHACLRFKPEQRPSAKEVVELLELCGHERPAGAAPAEQFQAQPSASYRATIEDSARRLHSADADRRRSWDCRASIDVRRVQELTSVERSMQSLIARSSTLYNPNAAPASTPATSSPHDSHKSGNSIRRGGFARFQQDSAPASQLQQASVSPFALAEGPEGDCDGSGDDSGPLLRRETAARCRPTCSVPVDDSAALASSSGLLAPSTCAPSPTPRELATTSPAGGQLAGATLAASSSFTAPATGAPARYQTASAGSVGGKSAARPGVRSGPAPPSMARASASVPDLYASLLAHADSCKSPRASLPATPEEGDACQASSVAPGADAAHAATKAGAAGRASVAASSSLYQLGVFSAPSAAPATRVATSSLYQLGAFSADNAPATKATASSLYQLDAFSANSAPAAAPAPPPRATSTLYSDIFALAGSGAAGGDAAPDAQDEQAAEAAARNPFAAAAGEPATV